MRNLKDVITYIDDVLRHAQTHKSQIVLLKKIFKHLQKYNLKLNIAKSTFGASEVSYLGYTINGHRIKLGAEKLEAIKNFQMPNSIKKIREFISLANFFFLLPHFSKNATQLTKLTKSNSGYKEGELPLESQQAFIYLHQKLCDKPLVAHPKHLATDASAGDEKNPSYPRFGMMPQST